MPRLLCTSENPAPHVKPWNAGTIHSQNWNNNFEHPDQIEECIDSDYGDYRYTCPHCGASKIEEGSDS